MDEATQRRLGELQDEENYRLSAWEAACDVLVDHRDRAVDDDQPTPGRNEKRAARDRVVETEAALIETREAIRRLQWAEDGIEEGPPLTIGLDNVVDKTWSVEAWERFDKGEGQA